MLKISELKVINNQNNKNILQNINLEIASSEIHLLLGPNGAGKSTLGKSLIGWPGLTVNGSIKLDDHEISNLEMFERAKAGLFLAHQNPVEVPGVHLVEFIRTAFNNTHSEEEKIDPWTFKDMFEAVAYRLGMNQNFSERNLNEGFSGGEKRKNEIIQMVLLQPKYAILDEVDSGLDIDSLRSVFELINEFVKESRCGVVLISHNPKILDYIKPDKVHVLRDGEIVESGDMALAEKIIQTGYGDLKNYE